MKKILFTLVLTYVIMDAAFAQQQQKPATPAAPTTPAAPAAPAAPANSAAKENENAIALDLFPLFKGLIAYDSDKTMAFLISAAYERLIVPHFSIGVDVDVYIMKFDKTDGMYLGGAVEGRYYPAADFDKFFMGTTVGFNWLFINKSYNSDNGGFLGMIASLKAGYKITMGKNMYVEPSLAYVLSKSSMPSLGSLSGDGGIGVSFFNVPTPLGWNGGLRFGFEF